MKLIVKVLSDKKTRMCSYCLGIAIILACWFIL